MSKPRDCKHGRLARKCEICELEAENEQLKADVRELVQVLETVIQNPFREGTFSSDRVITLAKAVLKKHKETT